MVVSFLSLNNIHFFPKRGLSILEDISFNLSSYESISLMGPSGSGKSTLAKLLAGFLQPSSGVYFLNGGLHPACPLKEIQLISQNPIASFTPHLTIKEHFASFDLFKVREHLSLLGLNFSLLNSYPHQLSGGQAQRFALVRALSAKPELLICDEILSSLDDFSKATVIRVLRNYKPKLSLIWITHDLNEALQLTDRILFLEGGRITNRYEEGRWERKCVGVDSFVKLNEWVNESK